MSGVERIAAERRRQVEVEGFDPTHDDEHDDGAMALAAACFATPVPAYQVVQTDNGWIIQDPWPQDWSKEWDKRPRVDDVLVPNDQCPYEERIDLLAKAGALVAAEIDRLERARRRGEL